ASGAIHGVVVFAALATTPSKEPIATETILILETQERVPDPPVVTPPEPVPNEAREAHPREAHPHPSQPQATTRPPASRDQDLATPSAAPDFLARFMTTIPATADVPVAKDEASGGEGTVAEP